MVDGLIIWRFLADDVPNFSAFQNVAIVANS
jgi:hypothetical protein